MSLELRLILPNPVASTRRSNIFCPATSMCRACPHVDLSRIERKTKANAAALPYRLLVRIFTYGGDHISVPGSAHALYRSPVDTGCRWRTDEEKAEQRRAWERKPIASWSAEDTKAWATAAGFGPSTKVGKYLAGGRQETPIDGKGVVGLKPVRRHSSALLSARPHDWKKSSLRVVMRVVLHAWRASGANLQVH